ncbi:MAG: alpha/beta fold hydrolase [Bacteroidia bacterium]|nr:alpha/beta fold hydrolase [Bacteroidia bacterium]
MKSSQFKYLLGLLLLPLLVWTGLFFFQEKLIFKPTQLASSYAYTFDIVFEDVHIPVAENIRLHGILFKADSSKGVVLYFHGNKGKLDEIGKGSDFYLKEGLDVLYINYRGYGLSEGKIREEEDLLNDGQAVYDYLADRYGEENILLTGISIGSGIAAYLASQNKPKALLMIAPYASFRSLLQEKMKWVPPFIWKYTLPSDEFLADVNCPVSIFHGEEDQMIPFHHAQALKNKYPEITLISFNGYGHTDFLKEEIFRQAYRKALTLEKLD